MFDNTTFYCIYHQINGEHKYLFHKHLKNLTSPKFVYDSVILFSFTQPNMNCTIDMFEPSNCLQIWENKWCLYCFIL